MNYLFLIVSILFSVASSAIFRIFSNSNNKSVSVFSFNATSTVVWLLVLIPLKFLTPTSTVTVNSVIFGVFYGLMLLSGFTTCVFIRLNLYLSNVLPSAIFFPVANAGIIILSTLIGFVFFKEKLKPIQISGII